MDYREILQYFGREWRKVEAAALNTGLESGFYPVVLPEIDDRRFVDASLPAIKATLDVFLRAVVNPPARNFQGLILKEKAETTIEGASLVKVTYLRGDQVYTIQCLKGEEHIPESDRTRSRYLAVSVPQPIIVTLEELQKVYMELEALLR